MRETINMVELFSGIGSQARALERLSIKRNMKLNILNTCEWDIHSFIAYDIIHNNDYHINTDVLSLNRSELISKIRHYNLSNDGKHPIKEKVLDKYPLDLLQRILSSIRNTRNLVNVSDVKGKELPKNIDILTYSFPCQDLSNVGAFHGYNRGIDRDTDSRSGLLWQVERILQERKESNLDLPRVLLLENVTTLEAKRHKSNFDEWQEVLSSLGYYNHVYKLQASKFGIPQNRKRLLMISVLTNENNLYTFKIFFDKNDLETTSIKMIPLTNFLHLENCGRYFEESLRSQPNNTSSRHTIWNENPKILDQDGTLRNLVQTITTKQDRHPNSGNIFFDYLNNTKSKYRFLTPRECFQLMGFQELDYDRLLKYNFITHNSSLFFSRDYLYKLAGNSIVVNVLEGVFDQILSLLTINPRD
jgi:DNA (cytosine-5)-methyltransferase 1